MAATILCQQALPLSLSPRLFPFPHPHLSLAAFFSLHPRPESLFTGCLITWSFRFRRREAPSLDLGADFAACSLQHHCQNIPLRDWTAKARIAANGVMFSLKEAKNKELRGCFAREIFKLMNTWVDVYELFVYTAPRLVSPRSKKLFRK